MKIFCGFGFAVKVAAFCLLAGFILGFHFGSAFAARSAPATPAAEVLDLRLPHPAAPCGGEEVLTWSRTPTSSWSCWGGS
ncbi:MAG TPA: hypothetical protein VGP36_24555 [Mycobacteriales bacterium]|nr:hypothetical protein [Mycobacteriales bacterium]